MVEQKQPTLILTFLQICFTFHGAILKLKHFDTIKFTVQQGCLTCGRWAISGLPGGLMWPKRPLSKRKIALLLPMLAFLSKINENLPHTVDVAKSEYLFTTTQCFGNQEIVAEMQNLGNVHLYLRITATAPAHQSQREVPFLTGKKCFPQKTHRKELRKISVALCYAFKLTGLNRHLDLMNVTDTLGIKHTNIQQK